MSEPFVFDPIALKRILDAVGFDKAIAAVLKRFVSGLPLDDAAKVKLDGEIDTAVNALVNQLGPELLSKLKSEVAAGLLKAVTEAKGPVSSDDSAFA